MPDFERKSVLDPIDVVTGECYVHRTDFSLPGPIKLDWKAYYSSQMRSEGLMGYGWTYTYNRYLIVAKDFVAYVDENTSTVLFPSVPQKGELVEGQDVRYALIREDTGNFSLCLPDGLILSFNTPDNSRARLEKISNRNGNSISFSYSGNFNLTKIVDSAKRILNIELDNSGRITTVTCSQEGNPGLGIRLVTYIYDRNGNLVGVNDANNYTARYEYDDQHHLTKRTDRNGYSFNYEYEGEKCIRTWGDDGLFSGDMHYEPDKRRTVFKGFDGRKVEYRYDENNLVTDEIDPYGRITKTAYDDKGNLVSILDRCGRWATYAYNEYGCITEEMDSTGKKTTYAYDEQNQLIEKIEPFGEKTAYEYDDRGNVIKEEKSSGNITINKYDDEGHKILSQSTGQIPKRYVYDQYHQLIAIRAPFGGQDINGYKYDLLGNVISVWDGKSWVQHSYDNMSRLVEIEYPDGTMEKNTYDPEGNPTSYTDRLGRTWKYKYRARRQLIEIISPNGSSTRFDYTKADELFDVIDPNGNRTESLYDMCDYVIGIKRNGNIYETYERDPEGRLTAKKDSNGSILMTLAYDLTDQPILRTIDRAEKKIDNTYTYDDRGNPITVINEFAHVERQYSPSNKIASEYFNDKGVSHEYEDSGRLLKTKYDDGIEFKFSYHGDTVAVRDPSGYWHTFYYDGKRILKRRFANGFDETHDYDLNGVIIKHAIQADGGKGKLYLDRDYTYDILGRLASLQDLLFKSYFEYDVQDRLIAVQTEASPNVRTDEERFTYDAGGNAYSEKISPKPYFQSGNRLAFWGNRRLSYDYRERLVLDERPEGKYKYSYDSADQLISAELPNNQTAVYEYDGLRRRSSKQIGDSRTIFGWEGDRLSWEIMPDATRRDYFYANTDEYAPIMFCDVKHTSDNETEVLTYYIHNDSFDRPLFITDSQGKIVWSAKFSAYGKADVNSDSTIEYNLRSPGQYYDTETGLHYNYHRYYDPETCRYIQPDPIGLAGNMNLYAYGRGNPFTTCEILGLTNT